jgi:hypothetical protein
LFLRGLRRKGIELIGVGADHRALLDLVCGLDLEALLKLATVARWRQLVIELGKGADDAWHDSLAVITFVGRAAISEAPASASGKRRRAADRCRPRAPYRQRRRARQRRKRGAALRAS